MNLFLDCEWDDGKLISVGIVAEHGRSFYEWMEPGSVSEWVRENVMPKVSIVTNQPKSRAELQFVLREFLNRFDRIHVIADWPQDIAHFCELLITGPGQRIGTPPLTMEVDRMLDSKESLMPHHALYDAVAIYKCWRLK